MTYFMAETRMPLELQVVSYELAVDFGSGCAYFAPILASMANPIPAYALSII